MTPAFKARSNPSTYRACRIAVAVALFGIALLGLAANSEVPNDDTAPYPGMPAIPPIGARIAKYMDVPETAKGPAIDPAKGYRLQNLGRGLYMITDNAYQSMFLTYKTGVVVVDAPPTYAAHIPEAIAEITDKPITYLIYSHSHSDHIGGAKGLGGTPVIIAQEETKRLLARARDPNRPLPTVTFRNRYTLEVGGQVLELSYHGNAHEPGNIFIEAPAPSVITPKPARHDHFKTGQALRAQDNLFVAQFAPSEQVFCSRFLLY